MPASRTADVESRSGSHRRGWGLSRQSARPLTWAHRQIFPASTSKVGHEETTLNTTCRQCSKPLDHLKASARYCGAGCRAAYRRDHPPASASTSTAVADGVRAELDRLGVDRHPLRLMALTLAQALDVGAPATALPGIVRQLSALLDQATMLGSSEPDFVDRIRARRAAPLPIL